MKKRESTRVTAAELDVLDVLWKRGALPIREITDVLYPRGGTSEYATVQKLLERLESKGCVARDRKGFAHSFAPAVQREDLIAHELEDVAEKLCGGFMTPLLLHLVQKTRLTAEERAALLKLLESDSRGGKR